MDTKKRGGSIVYHKAKDTINFLFMVPSDPNYGGIFPQIAKGEVDEGETPFETATREMHEELGIKKFKSYSFLMKLNNIHYYIFELEEKKFQDPPGWETKEIIWIDENNIDKVRNWQQPIINQAIEFIKNR